MREQEQRKIGGSVNRNKSTKHASSMRGGEKIGQDMAAFHMDKQLIKSFSGYSAFKRASHDVAVIHTSLFHTVRVSQPSFQ